MKYALLIYADNNAGPKWDTPEMATEMQEWFAYSAALAESGAMLGGEALQPTETASHVRVRDGKTITADGPFAETKEALGGFYLIDVPDLDGAIEWAARIPNVGYGTIEIRPIMEFPEQG